MRESHVVTIAACLVALTVGTWPVLAQEPAQRWDAVCEPLNNAAAQLESANQKIKRSTDEFSGQTIYLRSEVVRVLEDHRGRVFDILGATDYQGARDHVWSVTAVATRLLIRPAVAIPAKGATKDKPRSAACKDCATVISADRAFSYVSEQTRALAASDALVNLDTSSVPSTAKLELRYLNDTVYKETTTDHPLPNVYRGRYRVVVQKPGYKTATLVIDLFEDPSTHVACALNLSSSPAPSTCRLGT